MRHPGAVSLRVLGSAAEGQKEKGGSGGGEHNSVFQMSGGISEGK